MADYIERSLGRPAVVIHPPIYGAGPFENYAQFDTGMVTMINPCAVKGLSIFLDIASRMPHVEFGAVPGWGTTSEDRRQLVRYANVRILPNARNIDDVLARTRVLLMPSLWYEGFGLIVMESMLRGIPVVASDSGGLVEAKRGTGYVIPVHTIDRYEPVFDEHAMPRPVVRHHDAEPWVAALNALLCDRDAYCRESSASRAAAEHFVAGLDSAALERYLSSLPARAATPAVHSTIESMSPEKRALLLERLRKRKAQE
jgi:glycosyltransferase involved in cell wall biosynthesis